jgi:hypothetical protein
VSCVKPGSLFAKAFVPVLKHAVVANAAAVVAFLPWLVFAGSEWKANIFPAAFSLKRAFSTLEIILREVCGSYVICALLAVATIYAVRRSGGSRSARSFLWISIWLPIAGVLVTDIAARYFFASRQLIFIIPALVLFAAEGLGVLLLRRPVAGTVLLVSLTLAIVVPDARVFVNPRENWALAAEMLRTRSARGGCILVAPPEWPLYLFFMPNLGRWRCREDLNGAQEVIWAVTPATTTSQLSETRRRLEIHGFVLDPGTQISGITRIRAFKRRAEPPKGPSGANGKTGERGAPRL